MASLAVGLDSPAAAFIAIKLKKSAHNFLNMAFLAPVSWFENGVIAFRSLRLIMNFGKTSERPVHEPR